MPVLESLHQGLRAGSRFVTRPLARHCTANALSAARALCGIPVLGAVLVGRAATLGLAFYLAGWALDLLDGGVAEERRRLGKPDDPDLGEFVDTVADKLLLIPVLLALVLLQSRAGSPSAPGLLAFAIPGVVIVSETYLLQRRIKDYRALRRSYKPMPSGKLKVWLQVLGTACLLLSFPRLDRGPALAGLLALVVSLPFSLVSIRAKLAEMKAIHSRGAHP